MKNTNHTKFIYSALALSAFAVLSSCQSAGSRIAALEQEISVASANQGGFIMYHVVEKTPCGLQTIKFSGQTTTGERYSGEFRAAHIIGNPEISPRKAPAGNYKITSIECTDNYRLGGFTDLASFTITAGQISNLGTLVITRGPSTNRGRSASITKAVRPMSDSELKHFRNKAPDSAARMVYTPMTTSNEFLTQQQIQQKIREITEQLEATKQKPQAATN